MDYKSTDAFISAVDRIPYIGFSSRIDLALTVAQTQLLKENNGGRNNVPDVLLLITDGGQSKVSVIV